MAEEKLETNSNNNDDVSIILHIPDDDVYVIVLVKQYDVCTLDELITCVADGLILQVLH